MRSIVPMKLEQGRVREGEYGSDASYGMTGAFFVYGPCGAELRIIASDGNDIDTSDGWEHVSVSLYNRPPNWQEMCFVKDLFWKDDECVVQFHPPKSDYINCHPYCLHMWRHKVLKFPMPAPILVGPK